jgi:RND family efflux transporter MFP subunit
MKRTGYPISLLAALASSAVWATQPAAALRPAAVLPQAGGPVTVSYTAAPAPAAQQPAAGVDAREIRAQLAPRRYTTLAAEIGAKVNRLPVPEGGRFHAGQTLVVFDCGLQRAQYEKAKATLAGSEKVFQANTRLAELNSIGKVELEVSAADAQKNRAEVAAMGTMLGKCSIPAPFSGRVAEQKVREQQYAQPGQPLLEIIDDSVLELEFIVPSRWLAWLKPGYAFKVGIDEVGKTFPARVQRIGARVDPVSQSVKLTATIDGHFPELIAGMSGRVTMAPPTP